MVLAAGDVPSLVVAANAKPGEKAGHSLHASYVELSVASRLVLDYKEHVGDLAWRLPSMKRLTLVSVCGGPQV